MNSIQLGSNELVCVDYSDLLEKILRVLQNPKNQNLFKTSDDGKRLRIDVDAIASLVATLQVDNPLSSANSVRCATVNFSPGSKERFPHQIRAIRDCIKQLLFELGDSEKIVASLVTDLQDLKGDKVNLDFTYDFKGHQGLQKQRLTFNGNSGYKEILKVHKLTIAVQKTSDFEDELRQGLEKYINVNFAGASVEEREDLQYILEDLEKDSSDFYKLKDIVNKETLGKLKKQAQINYLEFLLENINVNASKGYAEGAIYLQDLIRRLKLVEDYISDSSRPDGDYLVNYAGTSVNYKDLFSRGEAFDMLPIIPKIDGYLGETKNDKQGEIEYIFGLKLKFDGKVQAYGGRNVFDYHLNTLNPDSEEHKAGLADSLKRETFARKVLKIAFLYFFLFASRNDPSVEGSDYSLELSYNPITGFEQSILPTLKGSDDEAKRNLFRKILEGFTKFNVQRKITRLKALLQKILRQKTPFPQREYPLHIYVKKSILEDNTSNVFKNNTFFKPVLRGNPKEVLKYISIGEAKAHENSLVTLPAKITIEDIHFFATDDKETFGMEYDLTGISALPVIFAPLKDKSCQKIYNQNFTHRRLIFFPYSLEDNQLESHQAFVYRFTFALLAYICLKVLLDKQKRLFIPILRLHLNNKQDDAPIEKFIVSLSGVLSHLLNEEHRSNAQGIDIRDLQSKGKFKLPNVMSSLYSVLPKKFIVTNASQSKEIDKLAIVIISSRESDSKWGSSQKIFNLMGEIVGVTHEDNTVRVQLLKTFSDNYNHQQIFTEPTVVIEEVAKLYKKGYKHFLYIAKAPYSSTLHMTQTEDDEGLYFMSRDVIRALKAHHDIKIYPMFFDKYYAVKLEQSKASSLYIQDTVELTNLVDDPSKQSIVFFNLFNGIEVPGGEKNYNGVISYATLLNIYKEILDDEDIYKGLIFKGLLKDDILQYLTLFHFSRYQKAKDIHLKLDPYENLIGDNSVGKLSLFNHMREKGEFNSLAFLSHVRKVLNVQ